MSFYNCVTLVEAEMNSMYWIETKGSSNSCLGFVLMFSPLSKLK